MSGWLRRDLHLVRLGVTAELRNPAYRLLGALGALGAAVYAWNQGGMAASTALVLTPACGRGFALAACLWFGTGALRDQNPGLGAVLRSKPVDGARWAAITWATGLGLWLTLLAATFLGAMAGQLPSSGLQSVAAHGLGFVRAALIVLPLATISFALSRLTRSPLGATTVVLAFLCVLTGLQLIPSFLRPDYTQNLVLYFAVAALLLALTALVAERWRRGELRQPAVPALAVLGCGVLALGGGSQARQAAARPEEGSTLDMMSRQFLQADRQLPGFWLPDGRGGTVRSAAYPGRILLVYLFAPDDMEAARTLSLLNGVQREYGPHGVQTLAVCLSTDQGDGAALSWTGGFRFPVGSDLTTSKTTAPPESVLASVYNAQTLPLMVVTDRRRRVRQVLIDPTSSADRLRELVRVRLAEEPE